MVNHGVSRACGTCKQRRKKCDETRPVCKACIRVKRPCLGYKSEIDLRFRHYQSDYNVLSPVKPPSKSMPSDARHIPECLEWLSDDELDDRALEFFVQDFCLRPIDPSLSRGYLADVAARLLSMDRSSATANAARIVSLDSLGQRFNRSSLRYRAQWIYQKELIAFQTRMADETTARSTESLVVTTLFGLYEMISATFAGESEHKVHALGITAILRTSNSPMGLLADVISGSTTSLLKRRLLTPPGISDNGTSLDDLAFSTTPALWRARQLFDAAGKPRASASELNELFLQAERSFLELGRWEQHQGATMSPQTVGIAGEREIKGPHGAVFWTGPVDVYYDQWVAGTWSVWRKGMIILASIATQCAKALPTHAEFLERASTLRSQAQEIIKGLLSSLPFFLLANVSSVFQDGAEPKPGPPVGGLLILQPLYLVLIQDNIISEGEAAYMRRCLDWMGDYQGLGQAKVLSGATDMRPKLSVEDAHTIVWVGMAL